MKQFKKLCPVLGILLGILIALSGILVLCGQLGGETSTVSSASYLYDTGYATFGADFYNYVSNNAARAADGAVAAAYNARELNDLLKNVLGMALIWSGLFSVFFFGMHLEVPAEPAAAQPESCADVPQEEAAGETAEEFSAEFPEEAQE